MPLGIYSALHSIIHSKRLTQMELAPTTEKETPWKQGKLGDFLKISLFDAYTTHCKYDYNSLFLLFQAPFVIIFNLTISSR